MSDPGKNWNVVTGCDKYSDGCLNCYAEDTVEWLQRLGQKAYQDNGFNLTIHEDKLDWPLKNLSKKPERPARCFVTDMGDLFHAKVSDEFIYQVFETMPKVPQHRFYVLTKRAEGLGELGPKLPWKSWIWAGVTVESNKYLHRIDHLKKLPPEVNKFLMFEPLLSEMPELDLKGIHWVVVGGETNKKMKFRPIKDAELPCQSTHILVDSQGRYRNIPERRHLCCICNSQFCPLHPPSVLLLRSFSSFL
jgi:protein gp37